MIEINVNEKGAELTSIKFNGIEMMHDGKEFWNRHSPVLFPIVGKLKNGKTLIDGIEYAIEQHGFARDMNFEKIEKNSYVLKSNNETLKKFPFKFELYISYEIIDNEVKCKYKVINKDKKLMRFGLGGHPAFRCDYSTGEYSLKFEEEEDQIEFYNLKNGLVNESKINFEKYLDNNKIILDKNIFNNDAIIIKKLKSNKVYLQSKNETILEFTFKEFPYLGIWSKPNAKFICIEPWFNTADTINSNCIFEEKEDLIVLEPNDKFEAEWSVKFCVKKSDIF